MSKLENTRKIVSSHLNQIASCFVEGSKLTVLVRQPNEPDQDFMLTNDTLTEVINAVERRAKAESSGSDTGENNA